MAYLSCSDGRTHFTRTKSLTQLCIHVFGSHFMLVFWSNSCLLEEIQLWWCFTFSSLLSQIFSQLLTCWFEFSIDFCNNLTCQNILKGSWSRPIHGNIRPFQLISKYHDKELIERKSFSHWFIGKFKIKHKQQWIHCENIIHFNVGNKKNTKVHCQCRRIYCPENRGYP